ncbi:hypothetical protein BB558_005326 [Smittium angustum]|uniref:ABC1 atypical kinase-like domain-containing protein n=1 Tax=Smittium angustum TaxID=133377 RepID=A0A2U1J0T0_SMIAN|nr:hypothetical protein BB558_005326 [Smittium angustum]
MQATKNLRSLLTSTYQKASHSPKFNPYIIPNPFLTPRQHFFTLHTKFSQKIPQNYPNSKQTPPNSKTFYKLTFYPFILAKNPKINSNSKKKLILGISSTLLLIFLLNTNNKRSQNEPTPYSKVLEHLKQFFIKNTTIHCSSSIKSTDESTADNIETTVPINPKEIQTTGSPKSIIIILVNIRKYLIKALFTLNSIRYSLSDVYRQYIREPIMIIVRFGHLIVLFIPILITYPVGFFGEPQLDRDNEKSGRLWWYRFLTNQMSHAGPTFVKLSQWAATRTDIFPQQFCVALSKLHSKNNEHSFSFTKKSLEDAYCHRNLDGVFEWIEKTPIGVGAIAQVYKAKFNEDYIDKILLDSKQFFIDEPTDKSGGSPTSTNNSNFERHLFVPTGSITAEIDVDFGNRTKSTVKIDRKPGFSNDSTWDEFEQETLSNSLKSNQIVAIKVLHPRVEKLINRDLKIMMFFAKLISYIPTFKWLSLPEEFLVFGELMKSQLDLRVEAANLIVFSKNFRSRASVEFPLPVLPLCSSKVLVETFSDAVPLSVFLKNGPNCFDSQLAKFGLDSFMRMIIWDNFIHSDLHPGNILVSFIPPEPLPKTLDTISKIFYNNKWFNWNLKNKKHLKENHLENTENEKMASNDGLVKLSESQVNNKVMELADNKEELFVFLNEISALGYKPKLVFLDCGLVTVLDKPKRRNFLDLFDAVCSFNGYEAGKQMIERSKTPKLVIDPEGFCTKINSIVDDIRESSLSLSQVSASSILGNTLKSVRHHHVRLDPNFVNIAVAILILEGIGRRLDQNLDLLRASLPILREYLKHETQMRIKLKTKDDGSKDYESEFTMEHQSDILKLWVYVEVRSYIDRISNWGMDESEYFGQFSPFISHIDM